LALFLPAASTQGATVINSNYYDLSVDSCNSTATCELQFDTISSDKALLILRVSCKIRLIGNSQFPLHPLDNIQVRRRLNTTIKGREILAVPRATTQSSTVEVYLLNNDTMLAVPAGEKPTVFIHTRSAVRALNPTCTIHGVLTDWPVAAGTLPP
jgi:hypothetical protein